MHGAEAGLRSDVPDVEGASLFFCGHPQPLPLVVESADLGAMGQWGRIGLHYLLQLWLSQRLDDDVGAKGVYCVGLIEGQIVPPIASSSSEQSERSQGNRTCIGVFHILEDGCELFP